MCLKEGVNCEEKESQRWESMPLERCVSGIDYEIRLVLQVIYEWK
jgi:hypothetical protein